MGRGRVAVGIAMLACAVGAACGLSISGTSGDAPGDDGAGDGAPSSTAEGSSGANDGSTGAASDANASGDALPDARDAGGGANADAMTFCSTVDATFCSDFDEPGSGPVTGWDNALAPDGSTVSLDLTYASSPPRSLLVVSTAGAIAGATKTFPVTSSFTLDYDFLLLFLPDSGDFSPLHVRAVSGDSIFQYNGPASATDSYFQVGGLEYSSRFPTPSLGAWHHVRVELTLTAGGTSLNAYSDGTLQWQNHVLVNPWGTPAQVTLVLGAGTLYLLQYEEAFIDNVVVHAQ
jgi:hypothetical protein